MELRDRDGKPPLTPKEYVDGILKIRDGALFWLQQCVIMNTAKGTGGARLALEYANQELTRLMPGAGGKDADVLEIHLKFDKSPPPNADNRAQDIPSES